MGRILRERWDIFEEREGTDLKSRMGWLKIERWDILEERDGTDLKSRMGRFKEKDGIYLRMMGQI